MTALPLRAVVAVVFLFITSSANAAGPKVALRWEISTANRLPQGLVCDASGRYLFAAVKSGGVSVYDIGGKPRSIANVPKTKLANLDAMNVTRVGNKLYVALGSFFGRKSKAGLAILDVAKPGRPEVLAVWQSESVMKGSACVAVKGKYAYLGAMSYGVMAFDVSNPKSIKHVSTMQPEVHFPRRNPNSIQHPNARGMAIRGNRLFVAYDAGGLRVLNVANPKRITEIGRYINLGMKRKQQAYNNIVLDGNRAYIAVDYAGLEIVDISNPKRMRQLGWWNPWRADTPRNIWFNSPGHTNQLVLDKKRKLVYLSAGDSELQIVDVSNPRKPKAAATYGKPKNGLGVWGLTSRENRIYLAYIKTILPFRGSWSGIKAVSIGK